ncbi:DUF309 domain-containing protein [Halalkalibacter sp. APA_J-10(15)]|uniref:DUF309 domain-containing protein n=1 Tax=unclassified Halalkalibacter TaxID=2893063 RepID=UPI001FF4FC7F|nr:DUF309 domain-containing protein [Halalkalibacter sp. APA_J-10(15)]MCK0472193.1 DUF309 domain-containing protein [Halalkalibacter sp. APA_J-10(15)]
MYPIKYLDYLIHYHIYRDYFECHEILEDHWKEVTNPLVHNQWVALIQLAVGHYHHRRSNDNGARRLYKKSYHLCSLYSDELNQLGLNTTKLLRTIKAVEAQLRMNEFHDVHLPMSQDLLAACKKRCEELDVQWNLTSVPFVPNFIVNKHSLRDRREVIDEREKQLTRRVKDRELPFNE